MAENSQFAQEDISLLCEEYATPYHAIIREHIVMGVTRYFLERWVPVLGVAPATVVNTLRQLNFHTPNQPLTISGNTLAREASMSRRHLYTCLESDWIAAFIQIEPGKRTKDHSGKVLQEANKYSVRMDDPLSPADAHNLMLQLKEAGKTPLDAVQNAMNQPPRELWSPSLTPPSQHFSTGEPITARDVLLRAFPEWQPADEIEKTAFEQAANALHNHVVLGRPDGRVSKIIVPQYFRTRWWKHLGHDLAWSYLWLRGAVYENQEEGVARHNCWIPSLDTLLTIINRPREWWRRNVERPTIKQGEGGSADFFQQIDTQKGRDPASPQWVARQFIVRIELPIAPSDRAIYSELLVDWPNNDFVEPRTTRSQIAEPINESVRHIQTHRQKQCLPHLNTPETILSATFKHTESSRVRHIQTQGSATFEHRDSESFKALLNTSTLNTSQHTGSGIPEVIAAVEENSTITDTRQPDTFLDQLASALESFPNKALYATVPTTMWLQQAWPEPINPHTPAWVAVHNKKISERDIVALMLAISADRSIEYRPRYLSWLAQQWQGRPDTPPVLHWDRWQRLAEIPLGEWNIAGRQEWLELTPPDNRELPFGMELLFSPALGGVDADHYLLPPESINPKPGTLSVPVFEESENGHGLEVLVANGEITIRDVWRATLSQLSIKLHRSIYSNWVEGTSPVSYHDGMLTLRAKHFMAREQLTRRYNRVVEETVSDLAKEKITIRYVL